MDKKSQDSLENGAGNGVLSEQTWRPRKSAGVSAWKRASGQSAGT